MHSVTAILFDLGLPSFDTLMHNYRYSYREQWLTSLNAAVVFLKDFYCVFCIVYFLHSFYSFLVVSFYRFCVFSG